MRDEPNYKLGSSITKLVVWKKKMNKRLLKKKKLVRSAKRWRWIF